MMVYITRVMHLGLRVIKFYVLCREYMFLVLDYHWGELIVLIPFVNVRRMTLCQVYTVANAVGTPLTIMNILVLNRPVYSCIWHLYRLRFPCGVDFWWRRQCSSTLMGRPLLLWLSSLGDLQFNVWFSATVSYHQADQDTDYLIFSCGRTISSTTNGSSWGGTYAHYCGLFNPSGDTVPGLESSFPVIGSLND